MKFTTITIFATAITFSLAACGEKATTDTATAQPASTEYPLTTCVVSGEKLGGMGKPHVIVHEGVTVKLCCADCVDEFNKDAAQYVAKVKAAKGN